MKKTVALVSIVVAGLLVAMVGVPWMRAGAKVTPKLRGGQIKQEKEEAEYKAQLPNATPVKPGILSERQRIHSELYSSYKAERGGKTISGLVEQAKLKGSKLAGTTVFVGSTPRLPNPVRETPDSFLTALARKSGMVVRGVPVSKSSQVTEDDGYIFTDYKIVVKEVFKNNVASPTAAGETIIVTRPGGKVLLDGIIVTAEDQSFAPLPLDGQEVLLFLQFISDSGGYKATNDQGSFEVDGLTVRPLTESQFPPNVLDRNLERFVQTVRTAAAN